MPSGTHRSNGKPSTTLRIAPRFALSDFDLSELKVEHVNWLWPGWIASGKLHLWAGMPGIGKSFTTIDITARVTTGRALPDGSSPAPICDVLMLSGEDGLRDTILPRLIEHKADVSRVRALRNKQSQGDGDSIDVPISLDTDCELLEAYLHKHCDVRLVFIDPISQFMGAIDCNKNNQVRAVLGQLAAVAENCGVAIVYIDHLSKRETGPAIYRSVGSVAFVAQARIATTFIEDRDSPGRVLMLPLKNNLHAKVPGLAYRIVKGETGSVVEWESEPVEVSADEAMGEVRKGPKPRKLLAAVAFLEEALAAGPVASGELESMAEEKGIFHETLKRAKERAKAVAERHPDTGKWFVLLPGQVLPTSTTRPTTTTRPSG